jgi:xanthine/uracil/vitamin C permease (AzgA family)
VVGYHGSGRVTYEEALAAVFIESWIFLFISLIGLRGRMIELVPKHIMLATAVGIGLFLSHIGFQQAEGLGLITFDPATLVALGELTVVWDKSQLLAKAQSAAAHILYLFSADCVLLHPASLRSHLSQQYCNMPRA